MPGAKRLYSFISKYDPHVLSAYSNRDPNSKVGKMKWLSKNTKFKRTNIHLVMRSQKQAYAKNRNGEPNVLIDDYEKNIKEWEAKGGIGIHHTNVGKTIAELKKLGFKKYQRGCVSTFKFAERLERWLLDTMMFFKMSRAGGLFGTSNL